MTDHRPDRPCACHARDGYCLHREVDRSVCIDVNDILVEYCEACTKTWMYGRLTPERAAAVRRALAQKAGPR